MKQAFLVLAILLLALPCAAQNTLWFQSGVNNISAASAPSFSPPAGAIASGSTVTLAAAPCSAYIAYNLTGASSGGNLTGVTVGTSVVVSSPETIYAQVQSCPGYTNSGISSAAYTVTATVGVVGTPLFCGHNNAAGTTFSCTYGSSSLAGDSYFLYCFNSSTTAPTFNLTATSVIPISNHLLAAVFTGISTGTTTINVTTSASFTTATCIMAELSNIASTSTVDPGSLTAFTSKSGAGSATAWTGAMTNANANDAIFGFGYYLGTTVTYTAGTGYSIIDQGTFGTNTTTIVLEFANVTSSASQNPGLVLSTSVTGFYSTAGLEVQ